MMSAVPETRNRGDWPAGRPWPTSSHTCTHGRIGIADGTVRRSVALARRALSPFFGFLIFGAMGPTDAFPLAHAWMTGPRGSAEIFDPATCRWSALADMATPRWGCAGCVAPVCPDISAVSGVRLVRGGWPHPGPTARRPV